MTEASFSSDNARSFPSSLPIRSPSPDTKAANKLNRTISPTIELRNQKQSSPQSMYQSRRSQEEIQMLRMENQELRDQMSSMELGGGTFNTDEISRLRHRIKEQDRMIWSYKKETDKTTELGHSLMREARGQSSEQLRYRLQDKERVISELKKILTTMSDSSTVGYHTYGGGSPISEEYREKVRVLEMENERLSDMVRKLNRREGSEKLMQENKMLGARVEELLIENNELEQKIERFRRTETEEMAELTKINNALSGQIKLFNGLEEKNRSLERENERLIRLLKDAQKGAPNRNLEEEIARLQQQNKTIKERPLASVGPEKMTIAKIKDQYLENIKMFKQTVYEEVSREFEKFETTIKDLHGKLDLLEQRTNRMEHTGRIIAASPERESISAKMSRSMQSADYESPPNRQTKKKPAHPTDQRLFHDTQQAEIRSEVEDEPDVFRLETELQIQKKQKSELSEKYNQLTADYNSLNQTHMNSLQDIQRYLLEIKRLKELLEQVKRDLHERQSEVEQVSHHKGVVEKQHLEEVTRVRQNSATEADRIRLNYEEKLEQLRTMTEDQITRLNDTYNQEIVVLRQNIEDKTRQLSDLDKLVRAREAKLQQQLADKQAHIVRLQRELGDHQHRLVETQLVAKDSEEQAQTRARSYTLLESNYSSLKREHEEALEHIRSLLEESDSLRRDNDSKARIHALLESAHELLKGDHQRACDELKSLQEQCSSLRQDKEAYQSEHRQVTESLREASKLALTQMQDEHNRNKQLTEYNGRLEERVRELMSSNHTLQQSLLAAKSQLDEIKVHCDNRERVKYQKLDDLMRQAEDIKRVLEHPEANSVIDQLLRVLAELRTQRDSLTAKITNTNKEIEATTVRYKGQILALEKDNKLLQLRLETTQKELEIRMTQTDALRTLLDERVRSADEQIQQFRTQTSLEIDTTELETVQRHYTEGLSKLQHLIMELQAVRSFESAH